MDARSGLSDSPSWTAQPQTQVPWPDIWDVDEGWTSESGMGVHNMGMDVACATALSHTLSQDVKAAVDEIDSIVSELWRTALPIRKGQDLVVPPAVERSDSSSLLTNYCEIEQSTSINSQCNQNVTAGRVKPCRTDHKHNDDNKSKHKCDKCDKCYKWMSDLAKHQKKHKGNYHKCSQCNKSYALKSDLLKHQRSHQVDQAFLCEDCGKSFFSAGDLHKHVRIHTGERPYFCNVCSKSFSASDNFKKHLKVHSGDKPLRCSDCGQRFMKKSNLQQHFRIHLGEKPFQCETCGQSFTQKTHLTTHISTHSGLKPYFCSSCDQRFTRNADLKRHIGRAHLVRTENRGL